jgi:hypothetical protein
MVRLEHCDCGYGQRQNVATVFAKASVNRNRGGVRLAACCRSTARDEATTQHLIVE